ncbi:pentapeptide repeat-containing protein [Actinoallomurus rhizosphaericola]|uniref:pentapeptide repeat-containing protein n=1 Tax=Actinoallomurus rhizosphaericola TaxID=2952536 RepID=UPI0020939AD5|nr:pentapeptide repeat-containing protein [Actinoallomurus rhizosphaericola]MCO5998488.1 pentapeptide repeat-containing protein [Actinoallomurus rhizosphaericola]
MRAAVLRALGWTLIGLVAAALVVLVVAAFGPLPARLLKFSPAAARLSANEHILAEGAIRTALLQAVGGILLVFGAVTAWRQMLIARGQQRLGRRVAVTEAFAKAVEQLAKDDALALRLGGVYALDRIADDDPTERRRIAQILSAFVRDGAPASGALPRDVRTALEVLTKRDWSVGIDLAGARLAGASLPAARLTDAVLTGTDLSGATLRGAILRGADLSGADLRRADLSGADLRTATLTGAHLSAARATASTRWPDGFVPAENGIQSDRPA